jgi:hypothetical protein
MMNPDEGLVRELTDSFNEEQARAKGFTAKFHIGEIIEIKGIYFKVLNFVEEYNTMNLKCIPKTELIQDRNDRVGG